MPLSWCVVMADSRPYATSQPLQDWQQVARINEHYARIHGYGFAYSQVGAGVSWDGKPKDAPICVHPDRGSRSAAWCKIPAIARVLLHGVGGRPCKRAMFIDSDAVVTNLTMSIDDYLDRARAIGDEALAGDEGSSPWSVLLSNNYWFNPDGPCTGLLYVDGSNGGCGILRSWWDARSDATNQRHPWEQAPLADGYRFRRELGDRLRVLSTSRNWLQSLPAAANQPVDPFVLHGVKASYGPRYGRILAALLEAAASIGPTVASQPAVEFSRLNATFAERLFASSAAARCQPALPREGLEAAGDRGIFASGSPVTTQSRALPPSHTHPNGSAVAEGGRRACWAPAWGLAAAAAAGEYTCAPHCEAWTCWRAHFEDLRRRAAHDALPAPLSAARALIYSGASHRAAGRAALAKLVDGCWCGMGNALVMDSSAHFAKPRPGKSPVGLWNPAYFNGASDYASHWAQVAPHLEEHLASRYALFADPSYRGVTAVHLRCSDVPFKRMPMYHLPTPSYWAWVRRELHAAGAPRRVVVFNSTSWGGPKAEESAACEAYAAGVATFLRASGMDVSHAPEAMSEYETLEALLGASAVVAGMPSSFSFLPGVAKAARGAPYLTPLFYAELPLLRQWVDKKRRAAGLGPNETVPNLGVDVRHEVQPGLVQRVPWSMYPKPPVLHAHVESYVERLHCIAARLAARPPHAASCVL